MVDTRIRLNSIMHEARVIATAGLSVVLISAVARTPSKKGGGYNANELGFGSFRDRQPSANSTYSRGYGVRFDRTLLLTT